MRSERHDEMPFDVEGWLSSPRVRRMTTSERGMFFQLLCEGWADKTCSLPNDESELQFLAAASGNEWAQGSKKVLAMFEVRDGRLVNSKQQEMLDAQNGRLAAARRNRDKVRKHREGLAASNGHEEEVEEPQEMPANPPGRNRFVAPTLEEVRLEMAKQGFPESKAEEFIAHYEKMDWCIKGQKIKRWRACVTTWRIDWESRGRPGAASSVVPKRPLTAADKAEADRRLMIEAQR